MISKIALPTLIISLLLQPFACANVDNSQSEEERRRCQKNNVQHVPDLLTPSPAARYWLPFLKPTLAGSGIRPRGQYRLTPRHPKIKI
jgi:hypothetical protein